jgi:isopentenyl-diphosphate delta-isomerase
MTENSETFGKKQRIAAKLRHVHACLLPESQYEKSAGFEKIELVHEATAALALSEISTETVFLDHKLKVPLMIAPMTGGTELAALLNERWARAAEHFGIAFGVGSQRLALENNHVAHSFQVRRFAPKALLFANLGAAQLLQGYSDEDALRAVDMIEANALFIHLNPMQELCQEAGDSNFQNLLPRLSQLVRSLQRAAVPVFVREVGFGLSKKAAHDLINCGISGLDCSGAGGTSWAKVEALCAQSPVYARLGMIMGEWGIATVESIANVRAINKNIPLIASGGLRNGLHVAKALFLGADLGAMAEPMLRAAMNSEEALFQYIEQLILELRIAMCAAGFATVAELHKGSCSHV